MKRTACLLLALLLLLPGAGLAEGEELTNEKEFVYTLLEDGTAEITGYTGSAKTLKIPAEIDGHPVSVIGLRAFYGCKSFDTCVIPASVKEIKREGFAYCRELKTVELPEGLSSLGQSVFWSCTKLKSVSFPDSITEVGHSIFVGCSALEKMTVSSDHPYLEVKDGVLFSRPDQRLICYPMAKKAKKYAIPQGTEIIAPRAFYDTALTEITVPESVTAFQDNAFMQSKKLKKINIPSKVTALNGAFSECTGLAQVVVAKGNPVFEMKKGVLFNKEEKTLAFYPPGKKDKTYAIPKGTLAIERDAFANSKISAVTIPGSVKKIGVNAFFYCRKLRKVTIPEGVEVLDADAFQWCSELTEVSLPRSLVQITGNPFHYCSKLKTVKLAKNHPALEIRNKALIVKADQRLVWYPATAKTKKYTVPAGVRIIGTDAFNDCTELLELIVPEGVEEIWEYAFETCRNIDTITLPASLKKMDKTAIVSRAGGRKTLDVVYKVPAGSYAENFCEAYKLKTKVK